MRVTRTRWVQRWGGGVAALAVAAAVPVASVGPRASAAAGNGDRGGRGPVELVGPVSEALDVNDRGVVVGVRFEAGTVDLHAFRRSARGELTDLGPGVARAVNDRGVVVGEGWVTPGTSRATLWDARGRAHDLGIGDGSSATDINDRGQVVGHASDPLGDRAFVVSLGSAPVFLPPAPGTDPHHEIATAINERGDVAGYGRYSGTALLAPVVWRGRSHAPERLPAPNTYHSVVDINEQGTVLGNVGDAEGYRAVVWTGPDHLEVAVAARGSNAIGEAINDRGQVAGRLLDTNEAFRWDPRTRRTTVLEGLSPAGEAYAIDDRGCAVGASYRDGLARATLFAPC